MRNSLCADLLWLPPEPPDAEDEEEETNEFRDPTRITVPLDSLDCVDPAVIQLARGVFGDADEEEDEGPPVQQKDGPLPFGGLYRK